MIVCNGMLTAKNPFGENITCSICFTPPPCTSVGSEVGLMEAVYLGVLALADSSSACARVGVALTRPKTIGKARASTAAVLNKAFLPKLSFRTTCSVMMFTILFLRSDPVTPDTQASGDPTQNSHTFKMLS